MSTSDCKDTYVLDTGNDQRVHGIVVGISGTIYLPAGSAYSHMLVTTRDELKLFVSNMMSKTLAVLDVPGRKLAQQIPTPSENQRLALSPDQRWLVTSLGSDHNLAFYRTANNQLDFIIPIDGVPFSAKFARSDTVFDAGTQNGKIRVWKIDTGQKKVVAATTEELGSSVGSLAINPFSGSIYVSDQESSKVSEINPDTMKVEKRLYADKTPDCILFKENR